MPERDALEEKFNGLSATERRFNTLFIELSIRLFLIGLLLYWSFILIQPFAAILIWSVVLAVAFFPIYDAFSTWLGNRPITAAVLMTIAGLLLVIGPVTLMGVGMIDPVKSVMAGLESGDIAIPPPPSTVKEWPVFGAQIYNFWSLASTNLQSAFSQILPQLKPVAEYLLIVARGAGAGTLKFLLSVILSGFILAYGAQLLNGVRALARRINPTSGEAYVDLAGATINAVSRGVMGLSLMQAATGGLGMYLANVPGWSLLTLAILVLGIIQIGPLLIVAPVVFWAWTYMPPTAMSPAGAIALTLCMLTVNYMDNVLKPFLLAHGLETPVPVIFIGVIGGVLAHGVAGLFAGPVVLAVVWELGKAWIAEEAEPGNAMEPVAEAREAIAPRLQAEKLGGQGAQR